MYINPNLIGDKMDSRISEAISKFLAVINEAKKNYPLLEEELLKKDNETQDILHAVELLSAHEGRKCYTKLKKVRKERRKIKDMMSIYEIVLDMCKQLAKGSINTIENALGNIRKQENHLKNRFYTNRTNILEDK